MANQHRFNAFKAYSTAMSLFGAFIGMPFDKVMDGWNGECPYAISERIEKNDFVYPELFRALETANNIPYLIGKFARNFLD